MNISALFASNNYAKARPATEPAAEGGLGSALRDFAKTLRNGEDTARAAMTDGADPHALVRALAETELAVETAITVRDKVVEAYQEILRMPV